MVSPNPKNPSVKDVAALAGVSLGTVSNVLNHPDKVRENSRAKVETAMAELGFIRNESARALRAGTSQVLAYLMLDGSNPFFADVTEGITESSDPQDYSLFTCSSGNSARREAQYLSKLQQLRVQGVLITPVDPDSATLSDIAAHGTPVILVDRSRSDKSLCSVSVDDTQGGQLAIGHLQEQGHTRIAFVGGPFRIGQVRERRQGALEAAGPQTTIMDIETGDLTVDEGRKAGERIAGLPASQRPTAAFCANDLLALGLLQQCVSLGLNVPADLAIVGYDDIEFAAAAAVPLTSVRQPRKLLGHNAVELLIDESSNPKHIHQQLVYAPELVVRASSKSSNPNSNSNSRN